MGFVHAHENVRLHCETCGPWVKSSDPRPLRLTYAAIPYDKPAVCLLMLDHPGKTTRLAKDASITLQGDQTLSKLET